MAAAGACLAIMFFGFGLLFNPGFGVHPNLLRGEGNVMPLPVRMEVPVPSLNEEGLLAAPISTRRGHEARNLRKPLALEEPFFDSTGMPFDTEVEDVVGKMKGTSSANAHRATEGDKVSQSIPCPVKVEAELAPSNSTKPFTREEEEVTTPHTFLFCPQAKSILPTHTQSHPPLESGGLLTLLVPPTSLGYPSPDSSSASLIPTTLLQVQCSVMAIRPVTFSSSGDATSFPVH